MYFPLNCWKNAAPFAAVLGMDGTAMGKSSSRRNLARLSGLIEPGIDPGILAVLWMVIL
jgi:hypothetical protein